MKLLELVTYFRNGGTFEDFCLSFNLNRESEVIEIYTQIPANFGNELAFFEIEKAAGKLEYVDNGLRYLNLFDFYYFLDAIEEANNEENASFSDLEIAQKLYSFALKDS